MTPRLRKCDESTIAGRLAKAEQFLQGAEIIRDFAADEQDIADAYVTLCVHCGVAAADVICRQPVAELSDPVIVLSTSARRALAHAYSATTKRRKSETTRADRICDVAGSRAYPRTSRPDSLWST